MSFSSENSSQNPTLVPNFSNYEVIIEKVSESESNSNPISNHKNNPNICDAIDYLDPNVIIKEEVESTEDLYESITETESDVELLNQSIQVCID